MTKAILIIEDDEVQRIMLENFLRTKMAMPCYMAENGRRGLEILKDKHDKISLVISDIDMPVMNGIAALKIIRETYPTLPVMMLTGTQDMAHAVEAMKLGAADFVTKPFDRERMIVTIQNILRMRALQSEVQKLQKAAENLFSFDQMIGYDRGLAGAVRLGRKAAMIDLPVLIHGETGTGKELFAKAIHGESPQSGKPFIAVNCGAIPSELVESTLFGHEKGSFTGATEASIGKFREADGGTIFLDEIGELPMAAQVKLLRVLQEKEVEPVGASRPVKVTIRIISAAHRDLDRDVKQGLFREDLFYRLNVLSITLPPLRARRDDLPDLTEYFLQAIAIRANRPVKPIAPDAMDQFMQYHFPGNVRELENMINRAFILSDHDMLQRADFDFRKTEAETDSSSSSSLRTLPIKTLADNERDLIRNALHDSQGNVTKAARIIGMAKSTLYRKLKEMNTSVSDFR